MGRYDDVYRTLQNDCPKLLLPLVNEMFSEHYTGEEEITFGQNEHYFHQPNGELQEKITDGSFVVRMKSGRKKRYHIECQSTTDSSMLIRMFEYDVQIALDGGRIEDDVLHLAIPHSGVLYLRSNSDTPQEMKVELFTPGGTVAYPVRVMRLKSYTLDNIWEKKLYFLIPFYIFLHESRFQEYNEDRKKLQELIQEFEAIRCRLEELVRSGELDEYTRQTLLEMVDHVTEYIARNYENIRKGVTSVMGGKVLNYPAKDILNKGRAEGRAEGRTEGRIEALIRLVCKKLAKGCDARTTAEMLEEDEATIIRIYNVAERFAPEYDVEAIYQELSGAEGFSLS